ncbi:cytochrome P450 [Lasiosphaeria miniovina]|uniref:Cytochrome P450 n=1 Tax=Lasiosphaeria miniovina TaxID=1954250 RepID=A0AA39ZUG6_9PEZI|nr:cytochrome P450 [Lasiosphaeria miniovina]KAK0703812.1 cytochrome P450 [Lasiosphaeria miniovina]
MGFPSRTVLAVSLAAGYLASSGKLLPWVSLGFVSAFAAAWAVQFFAWAVWVVLVYPKFFSPLRHLPQPDGGSWLLGQFPKISRMPMGAPALEWINTIPNYGLIRYLGLFNQERLLIASPKALAEVLVTKNYDFKKSDEFRHFLGRLLGIGLLLAEGDEHKKQRKSLMPAFAFRHIKELYPVFWDKARESVQVITDKILSGTATDQKGTGVIEVGSFASRVALDIIGVAALGRDFGALKDPSNELNQSYMTLFEPSREPRILIALSMLIPLRLFTALPLKRNIEISNASRFVRSTCAALISEKKQKLVGKERVDIDILSVALESGGFADENLVDQLMTFLAAGHETTASSMTWAIYLLAKHTDVQARLRAEIRQNLPPITGNSAISSTEIDSLPYLNAVCNEVLRYFSPVASTSRVTACDTSIQGQFVPKGTPIFLAPWAVNKSVAIWGSDAGEFNPERWMPKFDGDKRAASGGATTNYAFLTFLHGPRSCIGQSFAKAEFACLLAAWVGRFSFELHNEADRDESKIDIKGGITSKPAHGMHVQTTLLDGW